MQPSRTSRNASTAPCKTQRTPCNHDKRHAQACDVQLRRFSAFSLRRRCHGGTRVPGGGMDPISLDFLQLPFSHFPFFTFFALFLLFYSRFLIFSVFLSSLSHFRIFFVQCPEYPLAPSSSNAFYFVPFSSLCLHLCLDVCLSVCPIVGMTFGLSIG